MTEETFNSKLKQMRKDLISIVNRMNIDKSEDIADMAQKALKHVTEIEREVKSTFEDLPWDWQPRDPDDNEILHVLRILRGNDTGEVEPLT